MIKFKDIHGNKFKKSFNHLIMIGSDLQVEIYHPKINQWERLDISAIEMEKILNQIGEQCHGKNQGIIKKSVYAFRSFCFRSRRFLGFQKNP